MIEKIGPTIYKGESIYKTGAGGGEIITRKLGDFQIFQDQQQTPDILFENGVCTCKKNYMGVVVSEKYDISNNVDFYFKTKALWKVSALNSQGFNDKWFLNRSNVSGRLFGLSYYADNGHFYAGFAGQTLGTFETFIINTLFDLNSYKVLEFMYNKNTGVYKIKLEGNEIFNSNIGARPLSSWQFGFGYELSTYRYCYMSNGDGFDLNETLFKIDGKQVY